ncbi:MAG TPA: hypothetical protein VJ840_16640 [Gemmatimonadaceae bacterium]|nr:hypothetical protein [Gemmatimonadaceae bacterium]
MIPRSRLSVLAGVLLALACAPDNPTAVETMRLSARFDSFTLPEAVPVSIDILPNVIVGGDPGTPSAAVRVAESVSFDRIVQIRSNNPTVLPFLSSGATVPAFGTAARLLLIAQTVSVPTVVTIFATGGGVTVSADLTVNPPGTPPPAPTLSTYTVSPQTVAGGTTTTGTITLPAPAPAGGVAIDLSSRVPGSATVPPTVTVPAGADRVSFPISTFAGFPNSTTSVLLTAQNGNTVISSSVNVVTGSTTTTTPPPTGTVLTAPSLVSPSSDARFTRGSTVSFDWSDVGGAASYNLQIGNKDTFPSPLVASRTVTTSQVSISSLPTMTMWWRVRAIASDGSTGPWSTVRRFELK